MKQVHEAEGVPKPARLHKLTEIKFHPKMTSIAMYYTSSNCPVFHGIAEPCKALRASLVYMYVYCISVIDNYIRHHTHRSTGLNTDQVNCVLAKGNSWA